MPVNNNLPDIALPVQLKTGQKPVTYYYEQLNHIKVTILDAPSLDQLLKYIPEFVTATWQDAPNDAELTDYERWEALHDLFDNNVLPTAYETIGITFRIEGMDIIDTTHLLRHRSFSFSAQCTADRDLRNDAVVVKPGILNHTEFFERYRKITEAALELYADMVDSGDISILDARTILTRNLDTFYYVRGNLKDVMAYIQQRLDEQIQPTSDNIIAMKLLVELVRLYPPLANKIKIGGRDEWYIKTVPTGRSSNIYMPKPNNDVFDYKPEWFLYPKQRDDFLGSHVYRSLRFRCIKEIMDIVEAFNERNRF